MGSDADYMYEKGFTSTHGGMMDSVERSTSRDYNESKDIHFKTAQEAQQYAKDNVGTTITRAVNGSGYIVKE